jgi:maleate isomerase
MDARVGLIVPSSNTVMEVDLYRRLPERATLHTARMHLVTTTPECEADMLDEHLPLAVRDIATARPDVVVFGCTSAGALRGNDYEERILAGVAEGTGAVAVSVAAAVRGALRRRGARRVAVVTPYVEGLNDRIRESFEADGFEVAAVHGMGITENFAIASVEPERIAEFAVERVGGMDVDLVFASCTNLRALDARERIEQATGVPVMTSNLAALEAVLEALPSPAAAAP